MLKSCWEVARRSSRHCFCSLIHVCGRPCKQPSLYPSVYAWCFYDIFGVHWLVVTVPYRCRAEDSLYAWLIWVNLMCWNGHQITGDKVSGGKQHPHPPSEPPVTPRTPRTARHSGLETLRTPVTVDEAACPDDGCNPSRSKTANSRKRIYIYSVLSLCKPVYNLSFTMQSLGSFYTVVAVMLTRPERSRPRPRSNTIKATATVSRSRPSHNAQAENKRWSYELLLFEWTLAYVHNFVCTSDLMTLKD